MTTMIVPRSKVLAHLDRLAQWANGELVYPVQIEADLSDACNLNCTWCRFTDYHSSNMMSLEQAQDYLGQMYSYIKAISWTGGGEPLCNPKALEIFKLADRLGYEQGLYTNGILLDEDLCEFIAAHFMWAYISQDCLDAAEYSSRKGISEEKFHILQDNIVNLAMCAKSRAEVSSCVVGLGFLLRQDNWHRVPYMIEHAVKLGANYIHFRPTITSGDSYRWIGSAIKNLELAMSRDWGISVEVAMYKFEDLLLNNDHRNPICHAINLVTCLGADGTLWACPNLRGKLSWGNLETDSFTQIWAGKPVSLYANSDCHNLCRNTELNKQLCLIRNMCSHPHRNFV